DDSTLVSIEENSIIDSSIHPKAGSLLGFVHLPLIKQVGYSNISTNSNQKTHFFIIHFVVIT
ncbi:MAG: hypothetical protein SVO01_08660, partial [Thermotogota bacterium]|nr:hypothetical protein [Thermotogota bacterium]